jgi:outer membrane protein TolC
MLLFLTSALAVAPLTFPEAIRLTGKAPELEGARRAAAAREAVLDALPWLTSNPQLVVQPGVSNEGTGYQAEGHVGLVQSFNLGSLAESRKKVARAEWDQAKALAAQRQWDLRTAAGRAWLEGWMAVEATAAIAVELKEAEVLADRVVTAASRGGATLAEVASARAFAAETRATHLKWEGRQFETGAALSAVLGLDEVVTVTGAPPALTEPNLSGKERVATPHLAVVDAQLRALQGRSEEASAAWATSLQVSALGGRQAPSEWVASLGLGLTLPLFERGQAESGAQHALLVRLQAERTEFARQARLDLRVIRHELQHTREIDEVVGGDQLGAALEAARLEARRHAQGEGTLQELLLVRRTALQARLAALEARVELLAIRWKAQAWVDLLEDTP